MTNQQKFDDLLNQYTTLAMRMGAAAKTEHHHSAATYQRMMNPIRAEIFQMFADADRAAKV